MPWLENYLAQFAGMPQRDPDWAMQTLGYGGVPRGAPHPAPAQRIPGFPATPAAPLVPQGPGVPPFSVAPLSSKDSYRSDAAPPIAADVVQSTIPVRRELDRGLRGEAPWTPNYSLEENMENEKVARSMRRLRGSTAEDVFGDAMPAFRELDRQIELRRRFVESLKNDSWQDVAQGAYERGR
jgi:hypothetical protein